MPRSDTTHYQVRNYAMACSCGALFWWECDVSKRRWKCCLCGKDWPNA